MPSSAFDLGTVAAKNPRGSGIFQTSPGLLKRRLLGPWSEGLQQYLAIRVGDASHGRAAFRVLIRMVESLPPDELMQPPGPKAQLYRLARSVAETERAMPGGARGDSLSWRDSGKRGFQRLRSNLSPRDAEILELRHARELELEEIAFVLELTLDEAELRLDQAAAHARMILGPTAPDPLVARATVYVEAFALARSWNDDEAEITVDDDQGLDAGTLVGGRYQLVERVGVGAFGDVYRAQDIEVPGHQVALKMLRQPSLSERARQSALRELKLNAAAFHPSLVQFKDHGWFDERLWFVMPWYDGETLEARMRREPLSRAEARAIFERLARALAALHAAGIRHQDIKPENVLLTRLPNEEGILPVLIDLGVAAEEQEAMLGGTPLYFAPEVAACFSADGPLGPDVGASADVFALALALRNALEPETQADVAGGAVRAFIERRAVEMPTLPGGRDLRFLKPSLSRWMSLDPDERPTAVEFADELGVLTLPEERRERRLRLMRWIVPLLLTFAAVFGSAVYAMQRQVARGEHAAETARAAAAGARADLIVADARQEAMQEGHSELLARYEQSRLSRSDLAAELATTDGQLTIVRRQLSASIAARRELGSELDTSRSALTSVTRSLEATETERDQIEEERDRAQGERDRAQGERDRLGEALSASQLRTREATARADGLATELSAARARGDALEVEATEARSARDAAQGELSGLRARVAGLAAALVDTPVETPETAPETAPTDVVE